MTLLLALATFAAALWLGCALEDAWRDTHRIDRVVRRGRDAHL